MLTHRLVRIDEPSVVPVERQEFNLVVQPTEIGTGLDRSLPMPHPMSANSVEDGAETIVFGNLDPTTLAPASCEVASDGSELIRLFRVTNNLTDQ